jgi:hypothetical protein
MGIQSTRLPRCRSLQYERENNEKHSSNDTIAAAGACSRRAPPRSAVSGRWLGAIALCAGALLAATSHDAAAYAANACLIARGGTGCTANDGSIASVTLNGGNNPFPGINPSSCSSGSTIPSTC